MGPPPSGLTLDLLITQWIQLLYNQKQNISILQSQIQEMQLLCSFIELLFTFSETVIGIVDNLFPHRRALVLSILAWVRREE